VARNPLTDAEKRAIVTLSRAGKSASEIGRTLGRSQTCISKFAAGRGLELRNGRNWLSDQDVQRMEELFSLSYPAAAVAKEIGVSASTVTAFARRAGVMLRPPACHRTALLRFDESEYHALRFAAARKAMSVPGFCRAIVAAVVADGIVDAVLDVNAPIAG
jgi:Helix-turn-helix domain